MKYTVGPACFVFDYDGSFLLQPVQYAPMRRRRESARAVGVMSPASDLVSVDYGVFACISVGVHVVIG